MSGLLQQPHSLANGKPGTTLCVAGDDNAASQQQADISVEELKHIAALLSAITKTRWEVEPSELIGKGVLVPNHESIHRIKTQIPASVASFMTKGNNTYVVLDSINMDALEKMAQPQSASHSRNCAGGWVGSPTR